MAKKGIIHPVLSIIAGILIIIFPGLLGWIVGIYLVVTGLMNLK